MALRPWLLCACLAALAGCPESDPCAGGTLSCDDGNPCTDDACEPGRGCAHVPNAAACDGCAGNACCTSACSQGACKASPYTPECDGVCAGACDEQACPDDCAPPPCPGGCAPGTSCVALPGGGGDAGLAFGCVPEKETACADGRDEDLDTWADCADPDCALDPACAKPPAEVCDNGKDDDGDGKADCEDADCGKEPKCAPRDEVCDNGKDDDGDGKADCEDADCAAEPRCAPPKEVCDDQADQDGDGKTDCDDEDCAAEPGCAPPAPEDCANTLDDDGDGKTDCLDGDCAGKDSCIQLAEPGDVVVAEIMVNPRSVADSAGEWIELVNTTATDIDVAGWVLHDVDASAPQWHVVQGRGPVVVKAGGRLVLGASANPAANGGVLVDYAWAGFDLDDAADEVVLEVKGERIDEVKYSTPGWPVAEGSSLTLDPGKQTSTANDDPLSWCQAISAYNAQDRGTPGAANDACP